MVLPFEVRYCPVNIMKTDSAAFPGCLISFIMLWNAILKGREVMDIINEMVKRGLTDPVIEEALEQMESADSEKRLAELHAICSDVMFRKAQYTDAVYHGEKAVEADPGLAEGHMHLGWALYWVGLNHRALEHLTKACEIQPASAEAHYRLGSLLANAMGNREEAEKCFSRAVEKDASHALAWQQRGICRWNLGNREGAEHDYRKGAEAGDAWCGYILEYNGFPLITAGEKMALADDCWAQNQRDRSVELMREAIQGGFENPEKELEARLKLADSLSIMKMNEQAEMEFGLAIERAPDDPSCYMKRGWHFYNDSQDDRAEQDISKAMALDPENSLYPARLGNLYAVSGRPDEGLKVLDPAIERDPISRHLFYSRALCRMKLGMDEAAVEDFRRADFLGHTETQKDRRQVYGDTTAMDFFSAGLEAGDGRDLQKASELFHKAAEMFDAEKEHRGDLAWRYPAKSLHNLGYYQHMIGGMHQEAEKNMKKALEMLPYYKDAWISLGNLYDSWDRKDEALDSFNRAIDLQANDGRGYYSRGRIHLAKGRFDEGAEDFSRAAAFYNRNDWKGDAYYNRARCHEGAGRIQQAIEDYEQAFNHGIQQDMFESVRLRGKHGME